MGGVCWRRRRAVDRRLSRRVAGAARGCTCCGRRAERLVAWRVCVAWAWASEHDRCGRRRSAPAPSSAARPVRGARHSVLPACGARRRRASSWHTASAAMQQASSRLGRCERLGVARIAKRPAGPEERHGCPLLRGTTADYWGLRRREVRRRCGLSISPRYRAMVWRFMEFRALVFCNLKMRAT